jgi:PAS domain S-box-containing protein
VQGSLLFYGVRDYAVYLLDPTGCVVSWNPGAELVKGYTAAEVLGNNFSIFFTKEDQGATEPVRELLAAVDGRVENEGWRLRKDGRRFWARVVITPVRGRAGELIGFLKVTRDMTGRAHVEELSSELKR